MSVPEKPALGAYETAAPPLTIWTAPFAPGVTALTVSVSVGSGALLSFASTLIVALPFCIAVPVSATAVGSSLTAVTLIVKVTGALFHTQGGLLVDLEARVLRRTGGVLPNLFAGGGAACGLSGSGRDGYLSGNGLLAAAVLGATAGRNAAMLVNQRG